MKKSTLLCVLTFILIFAVNIFAQDDEEDEKWRNWEVSMFGGLTMPSGFDWYDSLKAKTGLNFGISGGYYFSNKLCFGLYFNYTQMAPEEPGSLDLRDLHYKMYDAGLYGKYAFAGESNFEPYIKLSAGANFPKFMTWVGPTRTRMREISYDPGLSAAGYLGAIYYTSDYGGIFLELGYHYDLIQYDEATFDDVTYVVPDDVNYIQINAGVTVFFGPE
jgi:hypothetical protein